MKVLLVAPEPFYVERGTPIAVRLLAEKLCEFGHAVDLLTYHAGADIELPGLRIFRARRPPGVDHVPIGISWQKLVCDWFLVLRMMSLLRRNDYDVVHAVEEAMFPAVMLNWRSRRKIVYDMDSWMSEQLTDKWRFLRPMHSLLIGMERRAIQRTAVVLPVCEDLAQKVRPWIDPARVIVLPDVPMGDQDYAGEVDSLRSLVGQDVVIGLYVGNLERYQGIDLLLESLARLPKSTRFRMIVIGGSDADIARYRQESERQGVAALIHFAGPRPLAQLNALLVQADILVSPRTKGGNTPMKVYSYMQSGKAIIGTDIRTHTQVLDESCAELVAPEAAAFAAGIERLVNDAEHRRRIGAAARHRAESEYSMTAYRERLARAYDLISEA
ncbi:MAG: glycosyltransferase family 4 protein [Steroidobacteraceae bacterium]